jgi:putative hydrolase of the HAD superfamily
VIFDLWGTLVDEVPGREDVMERMAVSLGLDRGEFERAWNESYDDRMRGGTVEEHLRRIAGEQADVSAAASTRREFVRRCLVPRADVPRTFAELRRRGLKLGLLSVCSSDVAEIWPDLGLDVDAALFSCAEEVAKPDPEVFRLAADRLGVAPSACLFVDDNVPNLVGAEEAGMRAVLIGEGDGWRGDRVDAVSGVLELVGGLGETPAESPGDERRSTKPS